MERATKMLVYGIIPGVWKASGFDGICMAFERQVPLVRT